MSMKSTIEDHPLLSPSWKFRVRRFFLTSEIPLALLLTAAIFISGACILSVFFMVAP